MPELRAVVPPKPLEVSVDFGPDAVIVLSFDANKVTPRWFSEMRNRLVNEDDVLSVAKALSEVIVTWNLTADSQPVEPSVETLAQFPISHLTQLMDAISEVPTRAEGEVSSGLSSGSQLEQSTASTPPQPERQQMPPNGQTPSPSPTPSEPLRT